MTTAQTAIWYAVGIIAQAFLTGLTIQIAAGAVPFPPAWAWLAMPVQMALVAATALLPRLPRGEP